MKPSFALDFRDGLVTLLHRTSRGWSQVGATSFEAPDLVDALSYLRSTALGLSPRGITTKLILPNDQILYHQVHAPGPEPAKRKRQIRAALEGFTPYSIDDLVYDWSGTGSELQVAVVAKETLAEAEAFATEHRFNPVSFVAAPENGAFLGEAFFGPTAAAATLLAPEEKVERDTDPVNVVARDFSRTESTPQAPSDPVAEEVPAPASDPEPAAPEPPEPEPFVFADQVSEGFAPVPLPSRVAPLGAKSAADTTASVSTNTHTDAESAKPEVEQTGSRSATPSQAKPEISEAAEPSARPAPSSPLEKALLSVAGQKAENLKRPEQELPPVPEAPMAVDVAPEPAGLAQDDDIPPAPASEIAAAFANRRNAAIAAATAGTTKTASAAPVSKIPSVGAAPAGPRPSVPRPSTARPAAVAGGKDAVPFPTRSGMVPTGAPGPRPTLVKSGKPGGALVTAPGILGAKRERNVVPISSASSPDAQEATASRAATKPGFGLGSKNAPVKGKPRFLFPILIGALLLLLVAVAAWSSFFMGTTDPTGAGMPPPATSSELSARSASQTASAASGTSDAQTADASPAVADTEASKPAEPQDAANETAAGQAADQTAAMEQTADATAQIAQATSAGVAATSPDMTATGAPTDAAPVLDAANTNDATAANVPAAPDAASETTASNTPSPPESDTITTSDATTPAAAPAIEPAPKTEVSSAGVVAAPAPSTPQDLIVVASDDVPPRTLAPATLPAIKASTDAGPVAAPPPPPFGTVYKFDDEGRIVPTRDGIMTPDGVLLVAGKPKVTPPERPTDLTGPAPAAQAPSVSTPADPTAAVDAAIATVTAPSAAAAPAASASPAPAPEATPASLPQDPTLRGKHPRNRPADLPAPLPQAQKQQGALPDANANTLAASLRPQSRPGSLPSPIAADTGADATLASASLAANGFALTSSPKPPARPASLKVAASKAKGAVDKAVEVAINQPVQEQAPAEQPAQPAIQVASKTVIDEQDEPDLEGAAPSLPTNASVAKQATTRHALSSSQRVALLAVFGSPSTRFAMVRQANGAVKKVQVGDNVDGGRIGAITENSVQYSKGGQMLTLSLPTG